MVAVLSPVIGFLNIFGQFSNIPHRFTGGSEGGFDGGKSRRFVVIETYIVEV